MMQTHTVTSATKHLEWRCSYAEAGQNAGKWEGKIKDAEDLNTFTDRGAGPERGRGRPQKGVNTKVSANWIPSGIWVEGNTWRE